MTESQLSICTWADATFGPASDASIAARALVEMAELVTACVNGEPPERIGVEVADVVIVLARLGRSLGVDLMRTVSICATLTRDCDLVPLAQAGAALEQMGRVVQRMALSVTDLARTDARHTVESLCDMAEGLGIDLPAAIDAKMAINRARKWELDGNGHGQHVKEES